MKWVLAIAIALTPGLALAYSESNKAVSHVGVQGTNAYILFVTPPTAGWAFNSIYFDITTDAGKANLSLALTARAANIPLSRIDYSMTSGVCTVDLIEL